MQSVLIYVLYAVGAFSVTEQSNKPVAEIQNLLDYLASQKLTKNRDNAAQPSPPSSGYRQQKRRWQDSDENNPNLLNIQTLNQLLNENQRNRKQQENEFENFLRLENDRFCHATGRCGCSAGRCGKPLIDSRGVHDVDELLNELNEDLNKEEEERIPILEINAPDDNDNNDDIQDLTLKKSANKYNKDDDVDIVLFEAPDSDDKLSLNQIQSLGDDVKIIDLRNIDLNDLQLKRKSPKDNKKMRANHKSVNPEDFVAFYEEGKKDLSNALLEYIRGRSDGTLLLQLLPKQRKQIKRLKEKQSRLQLTDDALKEQIVNLVFGTFSETKILPQNKNDNIYVPQRIYNAAVQYSIDVNLRRPKKLLPLTIQQKGRQTNKGKPNLISNHSWRRNEQAEQPVYGVPFDLNVLGLAQAY